MKYIKETKKFFADNRLNKGYKKQKNPNNKAEQINYRHTHNSFLPPINLIEHYEEIYPGTLKKLIEMAKNDQDYKHKIQYI